MQSSICTLQSAIVLTLVLSHAVVAAQPSATLSGIVVDATNSPLPGVRITVTMGKFERTTVTGADGRYTFGDLPVGGYTIKAELAGFETGTKENVLVQAGPNNEVSFALHVACLSEIDYVDLGFLAAVRNEASTVLHIRIVSAQLYDRCPVKFACTCIEYVVAVERVLKSGKTEVASRRINLLHEGTSRYGSGEEYVAFVAWNGDATRFWRWSPTYMFPVRGGRVEFQRTDAPGISNGMTVDQFAEALRRVH